MESKFDGGRFFFPDANEPTPETGAYQDQGAFATAMLQGTTPTLLFHGGEFVKDREGFDPTIMSRSIPLLYWRDS